MAVHRRREYFTCTLAYKIIATRTPHYLANRFTRLDVDSTMRRSERNLPAILVYRTPLTYTGNRSFVIQASSILNSLNVTEFSMENFEVFKRSPREALFARDVADWNARIASEGLNYPLFTTSARPP